MRSASLPRHRFLALCILTSLVTSLVLAQSTQDQIASLQQLTKSMVALADRPSSEQVSARDLAKARHDLLLALGASSPRDVQQFFLPSGVAQKLPASAQPYLETDADETGTVRAVVQDYAAGHKLLFYLNTGTEDLQLYFTGDQPRLVTGSRIRALGKRLDNVLLLTTVTSPQPTTSPRPATAASGSGDVGAISLETQNTFGEQRVAVLLVNFVDDTSQPFAFADMQNLVFTTVNNWYLENSQNQTWLTGDVFGWFTVPISVTTCPGEIQFINAANTAATNAGVNLNNYTRHVYIFPQTACTWLGLASIGGNPSHALINGGPDLAVVAHELGHTFGGYHSHSLECPNAVLGGTNCQEVEYGDRFDIMGHYTTGHFNAFQKERFGWLNYGVSQPITTVTSSGDYTITPYETGVGAKALKILMSIDPVSGAKTWFYVEYRQLLGFDSVLSVYPASTMGVLIHTGMEGDGNSSFLLNTNPQDTTLGTAALQVGQNFFDSGSGVSITLTSVDANGAKVNVQVGTTTGCTRSNPLVTVTPVQAPAVPGGVPQTFNVSLKNQDNSACTPTGFLINVDLATPDWSTSAPVFISSLAPQASTTVPVTVTAPMTAVAGNYQLTFHGTAWPNFTYTSSTIATFVVTTLNSITVTPANASVAAGLTQQMTATGHYSDASTQDLSSAVTWSSSNPSAATINSTGLATGVAIGGTTITAALNGVSGSTFLNVTPPVLTAITVTPANASAIAGATQQFTATGKYSDGSSQDVSSQVTWSSSNTAAATISGSGLATGVAAGGTTITATKGGISGSTALTVLPPVLNQITVTPASPSIPAGTTKQFTATGRYSDGSSKDVTSQVTWTSTNTAAATIASSGLATGVAVGSTSINATLNAISGSTFLTVIQPVLTSITVSPANPSVATGSTQQFTATGHYSDNSTQDLTNQVLWSSSNSGVATINNFGLAGANSVGTTTITAAQNAISGSTVLTVTPPALAAITVSPSNPSVLAGSTQQFTATGRFSDGTMQDLTSQVTWSSSNTGAATIGASGLATGVAAGVSTISATKNGINGSTTLTVSPATLTSITVTPANFSLAMGSTQQFTATGHFSDGSTQDISSQVLWSSFNPLVATISNTGLATASGVGATTIFASRNAIGGSTTLTVTPALLTGITVTPANSSLLAGSTQQFRATGHYSDGSTLDISSQVTWSSSNAGAATITSLGFATGVAAGASTISATQNGISGSTNLTITAAALNSITIAPVSPSIAAGNTQAFQATGHYSDGSALDISNQVTWTSSNTGAATISPSGVATGVAPGITTIAAGQNGINGSTTLTVTAAVLTSISVSPANAVIAAGVTQPFKATGHYSDGSTHDLTSQVIWSSSNLGAAAINSAGLATGLAAGGTTIAASQNGITGSTTLTVTPPALISIAVTSASNSVVVHKTQQFNATGHYSDNSTQDLTSQVTWTSSNPGAATINSAGLVTGAAVGATTITASQNGISGSMALNVVAATFSLFDPSVVPANSAHLGTGLELGLKLTADSDGSISGVRFYKAAGDTGTHVGSLWTSDGQKLAAVTFTGESDSGWQQANFSTPVAITANTLYVVSYSTPLGAFAYTDNYFFNGSIDNPPLHAPASGAVNGNGVYAYGPGNFPMNSNYARNYWVDVVFSGGSVLPPSLTSLTVTPANPSVMTGTTQQFKATGHYSDNSTQDLTSQVTWTSSNPGAATINSTGLATGVAVGGTTITASQNGISGSTLLTVTNTVQANGVSLFSANAVPAFGAHLGLALELGMKFTSDANGLITGVRIYKVSGDTGTHVGSLWTSDGQKLASVTFTGESDSGWQQANFSTPVAITANTLYVVSYSTPLGAFAYTDNYFFNGSIDNPPLHAPASGAVNGNGVYAYGPGNFPMVSNYARNYWVDVVFQN